jgi:hypothetical protein
MATAFSNVADYDVYGGGASPYSLSITATPNSYRQGIIIKHANSVAITSITDNQGNTYTLEASQAWTEQSSTAKVYVTGRLTNAPTSISIDMASDTDFAGIVFAVDGDVAATNSDIGGQGTATYPTNVFSVSYTADSSGQGVISALYMADARDLTADAGLTKTPSSGTLYTFGLRDDDVGASGSKTIGGTATGGDTGYVLVGLTFEPTGGGGSPPPPFKGMLLGVG